MMEPEEMTILADELTLNPHQIAPLTAEIEVELSKAARVRLQVMGKHGASSDVVHQFDDYSTTHTIPVLGLYPSHTNTVGLTFEDASGTVLATKSYEVVLGPMLEDLPDVVIDVVANGALPGMNMVSYYGHNGEVTPQRPFMFDQFGDIRWYLDFKQSLQLQNAFLDVGVERLENGNLYFGDASTARIYEMTMLGAIVDQWEMPGFGFHHNVQEKPDGNFLVTVNKHGLGTVEDHIIEIDRNTKEIVHVWDLTQLLDSQRRTMSSDGFDWIHVNSVFYDPFDNTIIISGRTQALVKLNYDDEVVWICAPHKEWGMAGNGADLSQYLLQPLDSGGNPIENEEVLQGEQSHPDFEWCWYQHAASILTDGDVILFDNGFRRNFSFDDRYSRAVRYDVDEENMTIQQVWQYGKERGLETFARIVSDVDYFESENRVVYSPGAVVQDGNFYGKVIELDYSSKQVFFEARVIPPNPAWDITFHRTERLTLYPN